MRLRPDRAREVLPAIDPARLRAGYPIGLRDGALVALVAAGLSAAEISRLRRAAVKQEASGRLNVEVRRFGVIWAVHLPVELAGRLLAWIADQGISGISPVFTGPGGGPLSAIGVINVINRYRARAKR